MRHPVRLLVTLCVAGSLALSACKKDSGPEHLATARAKYQALILEQRPAEDRGFDEVLSELAQVPADSKAQPEAERLRRAIDSARGPRAPRPLATEERREDPELAKKQVECAEIARALGQTAPSPARDAKKAELEKCRVELEKQLSSSHPGEEDGGTH